MTTRARFAAPLRRPAAILESAYELLPERRWIARVLKAVARDVDVGSGAFATVVELGDSFRFALPPAFHRVPDDIRAVVAPFNEGVPPFVAELLRSRMVEFGSSTQVFGPAVARFFRESGSPVRDSIGLSVQDGEGFALQISAPSREPVRVHGRSREAWRKIGLHLGIAWRLRRKLEAGLAHEALVEGGKLVDARGPARSKSARDALVLATQRREAARSRAHREDPSSVLELWTGLVDGRWSLVDRWESDGRRYVAAYENRAAFAHPGKLVSWEVDVLRTFLLSSSTDRTAFALGLEPATVDRVLSNAARRLGLRGRADLLRLTEPRLMSRLALEVGGDRIDVLRFDDPPLPRAWDGRLTGAQAAVAVAAARGLSDAEIAAERGTSVRTVSNLLGAAYRALGLDGRQALVRAVLRSSGASR